MMLQRDEAEETAPWKVSSFCKSFVTLMVSISGYVCNKGVDKIDKNPLTLFWLYLGKSAPTTIGESPSRLYIIMLPK